jgi:amino acid transporter
VVGTIIGSGIFLVPSEMMQAVGTAKLVYLAWIVGGVLSFLGALTYSELGAMKPDAGGEYIYLRDAYGPLAGFLYAWTTFLISKPGSIATIVTVVQLVLEAYFPDLFKALSIYLALIVVFAIILARAEVFAAKNTVVPSFFDGFGMGTGFAGAMVLIGVIRELFGNGTIFGFDVFGAGYDPILIMVLPPGGFILIGLLIGGFNLYSEHRAKTGAAKAQTACSACAQGSEA